MYYMANSRSEQQAQDMRDLEAAGVCIFCPRHLGAYQDVTHRTTHWTVTPNRFPYADTQLHLLLVPHEHVTDLLDLSAPAKQDFWTALEWVRDAYGLAYYGQGSRNGSPARTGGTIAHLHIHLIVGTPGKTVRFRVGS